MNFRSRSWLKRPDSPVACSMQSQRHCRAPLSCHAVPDSTGYAGLYFRDVDGRNEETFAVPEYPRCDVSGPNHAFGRRIAQRQSAEDAEDLL